ncbi:MAG: MoaD/ThiS family protein [Thermodesulforhabdaceae bacterium]|jgi:molybdopterin converting factor small subunit
MPLQVLLAATLRRFIPDYDPEKGISVSVEPGASVNRVIEILGIPKEEVKIVMVDGIHSSLDHKLKGSERVAFFPPVGGG